MNDITEIFWDYTEQFYGYGNWQAPIWFIGIEEAGPENTQQGEGRLRAWDSTGRGQLKDLPSHCRVLANGHEPEAAASWPEHGGSPKILPTWGKLIRLTLAAGGNLSEERAKQTEQIRKFQSENWGRAGGGICDLSLFPLPFGQGKWNEVWANWQGIGCLGDDACYRAFFRQQRACFLRSQIAVWRPRAVVIYFSRAADRRSLMPCVIAPMQVGPANQWNIDHGLSEGTHFYGILHPQAPIGGGEGAANGYFSAVGQQIYSALNG